MKESPAPSGAQASVGAEPCCCDFDKCMKPCVPRGMRLERDRLVNYLQTACKQVPAEFADVVEKEFWFLVEGHPPKPERVPSERADSGWIPWAGGESKLDVWKWVWPRFREGHEAQIGGPAGDYHWNHHGGPSDIVAYRVVREDGERRSQTARELIVDAIDKRRNILAEPTEARPTPRTDEAKAKFAKRTYTGACVCVDAEDMANLEREAADLREKCRAEWDARVVAERALAEARAKEARWKRMAEHEYGKHMYPDKPEIAEGALDAYLQTNFDGKDEAKP